MQTLIKIRSKLYYYQIKQPSEQENLYGMRRILYNNKRINLSRRHKAKCICTKQQRCKICEAKLMKWKEKQKNPVTVDDFSTIDRTTTEKISKDTEDLKNTINPICNQHLQNTLSNNRIPFKHPQNI